MKHIKAQCELTSDIEIAKLTIIEQSHIYDKFGSDNNGTEFKHLEMRLGSYYCLAYNAPDKYLYMLGREGDNNTVEIPSADWPAIKEAIEAYNEYFKGDN